MKEGSGYGPTPLAKAVREPGTNLGPRGTIARLEEAMAACARKGGSSAGNRGPPGSPSTNRATARRDSAAGDCQRARPEGGGRQACPAAPSARQTGETFGIEL